MNIIGRPGETPLEALARYNAVLGFNPADTMETIHPIVQKWIPVLSLEQLAIIKNVQGAIQDPDTLADITVAEYAANRDTYVAERQSAFPA